MINVLNLITPSPEWWEVAIKGMRNPFKSRDKTDSGTCVPQNFYDCENCTNELEGKSSNYCDWRPGFILGDADKKLLLNLCKAGDPSHRKVLRQLPVIMDIKAPEYFWRQMDQYKIGTVTNSTSQMHTLLKEPFSINDFSLEHIPGYKRIIKQEYPKFTEKELENEEWIDLDNGYKVSNLGRVTGIYTDYLKPVVTSDGYCHINMKGKIYVLSRIVADAFCPKRPEANFVNHINANKLDNRAINLEWVTHKENIEHSRKNHLQSGTLKTYKGKFTSEERQEIFKQWESGNYSKRQIAKMWNVSHTCINEMINGIHKYEDKENEFENYVIPLVENLNELRDCYLKETDKNKKQQIWLTILKLIPQSYNYTRTWSANYEVLVNIIQQRKNHKLSEWSDLIKYWLHRIPYLREIIEAIDGTQSND